MESTAASKTSSSLPSIGKEGGSGSTSKKNDSSKGTDSPLPPIAGDKTSSSVKQSSSNSNLRMKESNKSYSSSQKASSRRQKEERRSKKRSSNKSYQQSPGGSYGSGSSKKSYGAYGSSAYKSSSKHGGHGSSKYNSTSMSGSGVGGSSNSGSSASFSVMGHGHKGARRGGYGSRQPKSSKRRWMDVDEMSMWCFMYCMNVSTIEWVQVDIHMLHECMYASLCTMISSNWWICMNVYYSHHTHAHNTYTFARRQFYTEPMYRRTQQKKVPVHKILMCHF